MNKEHHLGTITFLYHIFQRSLFGVLLLILAVYLPTISRVMIWAFQVQIDTDSISMIDRVGNILVAVFAGLGLISIVFAIISSYITHISNSYELTDTAIKLRKGWISKNEISIPYKGIETVNIDQSVLFRILGLSRLVVFSSGDDEKGENADQIFPIIDNSIAQYLRQILLEKSNVQETREIK